jgi:cation:H+ antiporter
MTYVLFFIGFILLIKGADLLVSGASTLASRLGVSALIIGLTIVAFGTSAPELVVNVLASLNGNTDIAIGNILGSNIANILLILGLSAVVYPLVVDRSIWYRDIPFAVLAVIVLLIVASDTIIDGSTSAVVSRADGLILISFFAIFLYYIFASARAKSATTETTTPTVEPSQSTLISLGMIILGLAGLVVGGKWIVDGAVTFATTLGVSEALIGLTIVAVGTSLPELATSIVAAYKKQVDIAVGNIVGSNIFNIFWILGISAVISPLPFSVALEFDLLVTLLVTLLLFFILFVGQRGTVERWKGGLFVAVYVGYVIYLIIRG